ncbi:MAG: PKD repeat protein [Flavobacteriales bacterium]|jgi:PKD repeat protein
MKNFNKQSTLFRLMMSMVFFSTISMAQIEPPFQGCIHEPCGPELITNGDFEDGQDAIIRSDYRKVTRPTGCETYAIQYNAYTFHPGQWATDHDHTYGSDNNDEQGLFFIGDAPCDNTPKRAWYEYVTVEPNVTYVFSAWVSNLNSQNNHNNSAFQLYANGQALLNNPVIVEEEGTWTRICAEYVGTDYISMEVAIMVTPTATFSATSNDIVYVGSGGADFGLDDISFRAASPGDPEFTYVQPTGCKNEAISFTANSQFATHNWDFGTINASPGTSTDPNPVVSYALAGTYAVEHSITYLTGGCTETYIENITIKECDVIEACNTGFSPCGPNLVANGDFESGNNSFNSDFTYVQSPGGCARYSVVYDAYDFHPGHWFTRDDHTYGADAVNNDNTGQFFIGDAQCNASVQKAWYQNVQVTEGETYVFSAWVSNIGDTKYSNITAFYLTAGGTPLLTSPIAVPSEGRDGGDARWTKICAEYVASQTGTIQISIDVIPTDGLDATSTSSSVSLIGADFGIDDISFASLSIGDPQFTYTPGPNCANQAVSFTSTAPNATHYWSFGTTTATPSTSSDPNPVVIYSVAGTYTVTHEISNESTGCSSKYSSEIIIEDCPNTGACNTELLTCGYNLVRNGDFETGNEDFSSDYSLMNSPGGCARYAVVYNAYTFHSGHWFTRDDHTYGPDNIERDSIGQFFIGDAQCNARDVRYRAWYQNIDVAAGETYVFSAWVSNLDNDIYNNNAAFNLIADGTPLLAQPFVITSVGTANEGRWSQICGAFVATATGTIEISIDVIPSVEIPTSPIASAASMLGADFGLDDISFMGTSTGDAGFTSLMGAPCTKTVNFISNQQSPNWQHSWSFGDGNGSSLINPSNTYVNGGTYLVRHAIRNIYTGCRFNFDTEVSILDCLPNCEIESDFDVRSYSINPLATKVMNVEFEAQPTTNYITNVTGYSWTSTGTPMVGTGATYSAEFVRVSTSQTTLALVNLCVYGTASDPDLGPGASTCSDCDCKVYDVSGNAPQYVRPCTQKEVHELLNIPLPRVAGEVEEQQALKVIAAPNPFSNTVSINMEHLNGSDLRMEVYDLTGRLVETLFNGSVENNQFQYRWSPQGNLQEGVYLLKVQNGSTLINHKLFLSK